MPQINDKIVRFLVKGNTANVVLATPLDNILNDVLDANVIQDHIQTQYPIEMTASASGTYVTLTLDGKVVFIANYGNTTYAELLQHLERKDILALNVNDSEYATNYKLENNFIIFYNTSVVNGLTTTKTYKIDSNDTWSTYTDTASKISSNAGSVAVGDDGVIAIGATNKVSLNAPAVNISTGTLEGNLPTLVYKDIVKNINSNIPLVLFGTNKADKIQTNSSIPDYSGMTTFFAGYNPSMGPIVDYVNNNVSKLKVLMKNDVTYDSILAMYNASPYLPILNDGSQYLYPHFAAPGFGFSWFNFMFMGKDQKQTAIYYYFLSPENVWSSSSMTLVSGGYDNTDIKTFMADNSIGAELKTETIDIEV